MEVNVSETKEQMGRKAAKISEQKINAAISQSGQANIILATGASQFETLKNLVNADVDWSKVNMFHLDEYIGIGRDHPASFCRYLQERFVDKVDSLKSVNFVDGLANPRHVCDELGQLILNHPIDVAMVGIGENCHLAFNDPPADFDTEEPYIIVTLDEDCRKQQYGEGWFESIEDVPEKAISMSIQQILKSTSIIVPVPDKRKAQAVKNAIEGPVTNMHPASILQEHEDCLVFLDRPAAAYLEK